MECCKRPQKMPSKTGVSRAEIAAHAFECSIGSREARIFFEIRTAYWANPWCARRQLRRDRCFVDFGRAFSYRGSSATKRSSCHTSTS